MLSDAAFRNHISDAIDFFLETNQSDDTSPTLLWETLKAFIRGKIFSYTAHLNRCRRTRHKELEDALANLDTQHPTNQSPDLYKERLKLQTELDLLSTREAEQLLLQSRGTFYESGDRAGRLLAQQLKSRNASNQIAQIRNDTGMITSDPGDIFREFYSQLYSSESPDDGAHLSQFFAKLDMPRISLEDRQLLDSPLQLSEITAAIRSMHNGKSPGPDGFPVEFYKTFLDKLAPLMLDMFQQSHQQGALPHTLTQASISLILKKGKAPLSCSSFRPISLLPVDVKVLAKVFALRLESVVPSIISEDQTGFIRQQHSFTNIRRLLNIIHTPPSPSDPEVVISLDAEKAFDRVEWTHLFSTLGRFGFGNSFISWIRLLYTSPQASVCTNTQRSKLFPLSRGTRQGCPLSPLLFALPIER